MSKIAIITDSTANLPAEWVEAYKIQVVPLKLHFSEKFSWDDTALTPAQFYQHLKNSSKIPTTSQPSCLDFVSQLNTLNGNVEGIVVILLSSGISGTVNSALTAAGMYQRLPVEVVDTHSAAGGLALTVLAAARAAQKGGSLEAVKQAALDVAHKVQVIFCVDTLKYLHQGGRIGGAARFFGTALNIKPILHIDPQGKIDALERVRTRQKALDRLVALVDEKTAGKPTCLGVMHANVPDLAEQFRARLVERFACQESYIFELSPVIGVHTGPGAIGVAFY